MVARKQGADSAVTGTVQALFHAWRGLLTIVAEELWGAVRSTHQGLTALAQGDAQALTGGVAVAGGVAFLGIGAALSIGLAPAGPPRASAAIGAAATVLWSLARLALLHIAAGGKAVRPGTITGAWAAGLIPYALAVTAWMHPVAWAASGLLTLLTLSALGTEAQVARRAVLTAWSVQAAAVVLGRIAASAWVAVLLGGA